MESMLFHLLHWMSREGFRLTGDLATVFHSLKLASVGSENIQTIQIPPPPGVFFLSAFVSPPFAAVRRKPARRPLEAFVALWAVSV